MNSRNTQVHEVLPKSAAPESHSQTETMATPNLTDRPDNLGFQIGEEGMDPRRSDDEVRHRRRDLMSDEQNNRDVS
jgi:hypothetical protein